ncbi:MAG: hypothetical protein M5U19_04365, partial [Microthrixaceae bacterium]|nr:hypothetical protein [Microthrixaceae bacterium]
GAPLEASAADTGVPVRVTVGFEPDVPTARTPYAPLLRDWVLELPLSIHESATETDAAPLTSSPVGCLESLPPRSTHRRSGPPGPR